MSFIIGVDFDGTCVRHHFPKIGESVPHASTVLRELVAAGHRIVLFTMPSDIKDPCGTDEDICYESGDYLTEAVNWFRERCIPLWGINENPEQKTWTKSPKPYCHLYIDDAALGCPLIHPVPERPYVDWLKVRQELRKMGLL